MPHLPVSPLAQLAQFVTAAHVRGFPAALDWQPPWAALAHAVHTVPLAQAEHAPVGAAQVVVVPEPERHVLVAAGVPPVAHVVHVLLAHLPLAQSALPQVSHTLLAVLQYCPAAHEPAVHGHASSPEPAHLEPAAQLATGMHLPLFATWPKQ